jgi:hypothetical protein
MVLIEKASRFAVTFGVGCLLASLAVPQGPSTPGSHDAPRTGERAALPPGVLPSDGFVLALDGPSRLRDRLLTTDVGTVVETLYGDRAWHDLFAAASGPIDRAGIPGIPEPLSRALASWLAAPERVVAAVASLPPLSGRGSPGLPDVILAIQPAPDRDPEAIDRELVSLTAEIHAAATEEPGLLEPNAPTEAYPPPGMGVFEFTASTPGSQPVSRSFLHVATSPRRRPDAVLLLPCHVRDENGASWIVVGAGTVVERLAQRTVPPSTDAPEADRPRPAPSRALASCLDAPIGLFLQRRAWQNDDEGPNADGEGDGDEIARESGWSSIESLSFLVKPDGPRVTSEVAVDFVEGGASGWIASFVDARPLDLRRVAPNHDALARYDSWFAIAIDWPAFWRGASRTMTAVFNGFLFSTRRPFEEKLAEQEEEITRTFLGDPVERYFAHLDGSLLMGLLLEPRPDPNDAFPSWDFVTSDWIVGLADKEAFARNLAQLEASENSPFARAPFDQRHLVVDHRFAISSGPSALDLGHRLRSPDATGRVLEPAGSAPAAEDPTSSRLSALSDAERRAIAAPESAVAVGIVRLSRWLESDLLVAMLDEEIPVFGALREHVVTTTLPELEARGLGRAGIHASTTPDRRRYVLRVRW